MKKILIFVNSIDIEDSSGSKVNVGLIQNLYKIGYVIKVLHYTRKSIDLEGIHCIAIEEQKFTLNYLLSIIQHVFKRIFKNIYIGSLRVLKILKRLFKVCSI